MPAQLPSYSAPPLQETVLSAQFETAANLSNALLGAFWSTQQANWPKVKELPPVAREVENFDKKPVWEGVRFQLTQDAACRMQLLNTSGDRMLQLQRDRLMLNWVKTPSGEYPRFDQLIAEFKTHWTNFKEFIASAGIGDLLLEQWEVTYVNRLVKGRDWNDLKDLADLLRMPHWESLIGELDWEQFGGAWRFEIQPKLGRLHVNLKVDPKKNDSTGERDYLLLLTARGPLAEDGTPDESLMKGLRSGRDAVVKTFAEITSDQAQMRWGKRV